jgi:curli biogenesis system outer membrane secretion channel CsgG
MNAKIRWPVLLVLAAIISVVLGPPGYGQASRKGVIVVDFEDLVRGWSSTREVVTTRVISSLREDASLRVVPRERVQEALREAKVESAGYLDLEAAQKVAKALEADYVIMGQIAAFDQQYSGGCVPIVGCVYTVTATVTLRGRVLDVASGQVVTEPRSETKETQRSVSVWAGPWWTTVTASNFDGQVIGKATHKAVDDFLIRLKPFLK